MTGKKRQILQKAIERAAERAVADGEDPNELQQQLLQHKPFQQEVIASLLDGKAVDVPGIGGDMVRAVTAIGGDPGSIL